MGNGMSTHLKTALAYAISVVGLIIIGFGPMADWQAAARNGALIAATLLIFAVPTRRATAPHMKAAAWDECADYVEEWYPAPSADALKSHNPYRKPIHE